MDTLTYLAPRELPPLHRLCHAEGEGEQCVMEYISQVLGERFSDGPRAVQEHVAMLARWTNDALEVDTPLELSKLMMPFVPRILAARPFPTTADGILARYALQDKCSEVSRVFRSVFSTNGEKLAALGEVIDFYEVKMGEIGEPLRRIEVVPVPEPSEAPVKEPSPQTAPAETPAQEPVPA